MCCCWLLMTPLSCHHPQALTVRHRSLLSAFGWCLPAQQTPDHEDASSATRHDRCCNRLFIGGLLDPGWLIGFCHHLRHVCSRSWLLQPSSFPVITPNSKPWLLAGRLCPSSTSIVFFFLGRHWPPSSSWITHIIRPWLKIDLLSLFWAVCNRSWETLAS